jgi:hypothetical protein
MSVLGLINSDPGVKKTIEAAIQANPKAEYDLRFFSKKGKSSNF